MAEPSRGTCWRPGSRDKRFSSRYRRATRALRAFLATGYRPVGSEVLTRHFVGLGEAHLRRAGPSGSEAEASPEGILFRDDHDLVAVDFIGGDGAEGSIPCLEDDDQNHQHGGEPN